jgi:radical SAM superfamily enzyme YgiQ (UPF0313 family)
VADIVLINPQFRPSYWGLNYAMPFFGHIKAFLPVINLPLLAALTPLEHTVAVIDENVEEIDFDRCSRADIVGLTGMNVQRQRMHEILAELKRRNVFTVVGGPLVTVDPEDFEEEADVIFLGEAEETWPRFLHDWGSGEHGRRYEQAEKTDMATLPPPRLDLLRMDRYLYGAVQLSRGCPFTCEFCDIIVVFGRRPRIKSAAQVIAEIEAIAIAGRRDIFMVDDNLIGNKKAIKQLLREIIVWQRAHRYPVTFLTEASIDLAEDEELMQLMVEANIDTVFVGIESPDEEALRETKKIQNLTDRHGTLLEKVHRIQAVGMQVTCGMIVGFDADDETVFERQRQFIHQARIPSAMINLLVAIPKTPLFARLAKEGRLDTSGMMANRGYLAEARFGTNVIPLRVSRQALWEGHLRLLRELYTTDAFFSRLDGLYLESKWLPAAGRTRYLLSHDRLRWLRLRLRAVGEGFYLYRRLMRFITDPELRRQYRQHVWKAFLRRPNPRVLRDYCFFAVMHFHHHSLVRQLIADTAALGSEGEAEMARALLPPVVAAE